MKIHPVLWLTPLLCTILLVRIDVAWCEDSACHEAEPSRHQSKWRGLLEAVHLGWLRLVLLLRRWRVREEAKTLLVSREDDVVLYDSATSRRARYCSSLELRTSTCMTEYGTPTWALKDPDPHTGMVLYVAREGPDVFMDVMYELVDPVQLELGMKVIHAADLAYTPVATATTMQQAYDPLWGAVEESVPSVKWWQWWVPWWRKGRTADRSFKYKMNDTAFAGGSHGEVWRGRRRCRKTENRGIDGEFCGEGLIFKRLKIENGYRVLEAGLREVHFGILLKETSSERITEYVDHFFQERKGGLELWIVFRDAGVSLRSFLYTARHVGDYVVYQNSKLWMQLRKSVSNKHWGDDEASPNSLARTGSESAGLKDRKRTSFYGRKLMQAVLQQILQAASFLHSRGVVHRDIKPSNVMCESNIDPSTGIVQDGSTPEVVCVLGDFSSAYDNFTGQNLYTRGPSSAEQTDEYAPPEAMFGKVYNSSTPVMASFDSWSIGIVALELLLGTPHVFSVDQRTRVLLTHKMEKEGASEDDVERAVYLAALSQFCIFNPSRHPSRDWPLRDGDPLHRSAMTKHTCTLHDFHRALRARDPLGWGFEDSADVLLHLIWQLLAWDPHERITAEAALQHEYFAQVDPPLGGDEWNVAVENHALQSMMLDPRFDFNISDGVDEFICPGCHRTFLDWQSCQKHARARKHGSFCKYDTASLPTCVNAHSMLPSDSFSGYCDIQGRRPSIEDFHAIHLFADHQFYAIFDGHTGNFASKFAAKYLYQDFAPRIADILSGPAPEENGWKDTTQEAAKEAFAHVHKQFLQATNHAPHMDQSGTTATAAFVTESVIVIASLGDSRAIISKSELKDGQLHRTAIQLTKDHVASDPVERALVEDRGGFVAPANGLDRVNGTLVITRSIGDAALAPVLSRDPQVIAMTRDEISRVCGAYNEYDSLPCFLILASDGLWDVVANQDAVDLVADVVLASAEGVGLQRAAEALTLEAYVRGSKDNIGVCVVAIYAPSDASALPEPHTMAKQ